MQQKAVRTGLRILGHVIVVVLLYIVFSFSLFLGLQVRPMYGNIGLLITALLVAAYVYFGFIRKRKTSRAGDDQGE